MKNGSTPALEGIDHALTAEEILAVDDLELHKIYVPEWKGNVYLRPLPADEAIAFSEFISVPKNKRKGMVRIVQLCLVHKDTGERLFDDTNIVAFQKKNVAVFGRLQEECMKLNGFVDVDKEKEDAKND